jgi:capsular polysaccharide export protein
VQDDLGIYYDPAEVSRLERLIAEAARLEPNRLWRAERLIATLTRKRITKYNLASDTPCRTCPRDREIILVPGQVEDDASILRGAGDVDTNLDLLKAARRLHPTGVLIYKPHPDVEAGLRQGGPAGRPGGPGRSRRDGADPLQLIAIADRVVTMTSTLGFEALIRGTPSPRSARPSMPGGA